MTILLNKISYFRSLLIRNSVHNTAPLLSKQKTPSITRKYISTSSWVLLIESSVLLTAMLQIHNKVRLPHTPPRRRLRFYTRPTMHYTSFAIRPAYSFQIPGGGKGTLGGSPARRRRGAGRAGWGRRDLQRGSNGSADNGPIQRWSA